MIRALIAFVFLLTTAPAFAQPAVSYSPPDRELWDLMAKALSELPISLNAHQQIQAIIQNVQREAQTREFRAKADAEAKAKIDAAKPKE